MSHACLAILLATTLAAPEAAPVEAPAPQTPSAVAAPVAQPAPPAEPAPTTTTTTTTTVVLPVAQPAPAPVPVAAVAPASSVQRVPASAPVTAVEPAPAMAPPPPPPDPERAREQRVANGLTAAGGAMLGLGAATLLLTTWPSYALYHRSLERAEDVRWVTDQEPFVREAERRRTFMLVSAGIGAGLTTVGTIVLAAGISRRTRLRSATAATLSVAPAVGGGVYGAGASVRF